MPDPAPGLNPNAMSVVNAARLLTKVFGEAVTEEMIRGDVSAGAPTNRDGTLNLVLYAAWLIRESAKENAVGD